MSDTPLRAITRRHFFRQGGFGIGGAALVQLLRRDLLAAPFDTRPTHFAPKAKSIIYLFMAGAPSQIDLLDPKPKLQQLSGSSAPDDVVKGERFAFIRGVPRLLGSPYTFARHGQSGAEVSELLPHLAGVVDEIAILRSVQTSQFNHAPAQIFLNTGHQIVGRPASARGSA